MPNCQNCGSHVTEQYVRVFEPREYEMGDGPRACPNCEDIKRTGSEIRKKRA